MNDPQIIDLIYTTPGLNGCYAKFTIITTNGVRHNNLLGAHFDATTEAELKLALTKYADDQEKATIVGTIEPQHLVASPGKVLNSRTFVEETPIEAVAAVAIEPSAPLKG